MKKCMTVSAVKKALIEAFPERTLAITVQDWVSFRGDKTVKYKTCNITIFKPEYHLNHEMQNSCEQYYGKTLREAFDLLMAKETAKPTEVAKCA